MDIKMNKVSIGPSKDSTIMEFNDSEGNTQGKLSYSPSGKIKFSGELESSVKQFVELVETYLT